MANSLNLSPFAILASLAAWSALWGIAGAFLAVPLTACIVDGARGVKGTRPRGRAALEDRRRRRGVTRPSPPTSAAWSWSARTSGDQLPRILAFWVANSSGVRMPAFFSSASFWSCEIFWSVRPVLPAARRRPAPRCRTASSTLACSAPAACCARAACEWATLSGDRGRRSGDDRRAPGRTHRRPDQAGRPSLIPRMVSSLTSACAWRSCWRPLPLPCPCGFARPTAAPPRRPRAGCDARHQPAMGLAHRNRRARRPHVLEQHRGRGRVVVHRSSHQHQVRLREQPGVLAVELGERLGGLGVDSFASSVVT